MIVVCKMAQCPYYDKRGYCAKSTVVSINQMGMCSVLWRRGQQKRLKMPFTEENYPKDPITIVDAEIIIPNDIKEQMKEEDAGSRLENPTNGDAASQK